MVYVDTLPVLSAFFPSLLGKREKRGQKKILLCMLCNERNLVDIHCMGWNYGNKNMGEFLSPIFMGICAWNGGC